ncbi:MAG: hypothetical protein GXO55_06340 [Chloroflexi bacterium]|nr:hypothetical protein [Chloroflexota bacterium]
MRRTLTFFLLVAVLLGAFAFPVNASVRYCSTDPIFNVGGHEVSVVVELAPYEVKDEIMPWNPVVTLLLAPRGTNPYVEDVVGEFPEWAFAWEWHRAHKAGVFVHVPYVPSYEQMRVTVFVDGVQVKQVETTSNYLFFTFPW